MSAPTVTDMFCGAGGSSLGAAHAGATLALGLNHWRLAIDTHQANFDEADHDCADVSMTDPRRYRRTDMLIASPECTNHSLAKGATRKSTEPSLLDDGDPAAERSRATMWDVIRFAEHHQYEAVVVENVVDVRSWRLFNAWWQAMSDLGYDGKAVYLNSMHAGVGQVPQSRDRMYVVWWRRGRKAPNLDIRPPAPCFACEAWVRAVQSWRRADRPYGKYRQQYDYRCPGCAEIVHPPVLPAAAAIDWTLPAPRIGDRKRPLARATVERIKRGLERYAGHMLVRVGGSTFERGDSFSRLRPLDEAMRTQTGTLAEALVTAAPFIVEMHGGSSSARAVADPLATVLAGGNHHGLLVPTGGAHAHSDGGICDRCRSVDEVMRAITTTPREALVVPCGGTWGDDAKPTGRPLPTTDLPPFRGRCSGWCRTLLRNCHLAPPAGRGQGGAPDRTYDLDAGRWAAPGCCSEEGAW